MTDARDRLRRIWQGLLWDPIDWAERASGLTLIALRGAVYQWGPAIRLPVDVADLLRAVGLTDERWGTYLMVCGVLQIWFAGEPASIGRRAVTIAILFGFGSMAWAFLWTAPRTINSGLICMVAFYTFLLFRVFRDRDSAAAGVGAGHG